MFYDNTAYSNISAVMNPPIDPKEPSPNDPEKPFPQIPEYPIPKEPSEQPIDPPTPVDPDKAPNNPQKK